LYWNDKLRNTGNLLSSAFLCLKALVYIRRYEWKQLV